MTDSEELRSRNYTWVPIEQVGPPLAGRSGLAYFQALRDGELPVQPIAATIGWETLEVEEGRVRIGLPQGDHLFHAGGLVHGGVLATLLDSAISSAVMTTVQASAICSTLHLSVQYLNAARTDVGDLFAEGTVTHRGRSVATGEGRVEDAAGKIYAMATATLKVSEGKL